MKKLSLVIALAGVLAVPSLQAAMSGQITISQGGNSVGSGGEFIIQGLGGLSSLGTFNSFCLEHNETFIPGGTYDATVNTAAVLGGVATSGSSGSDPVSMGTASLYSQFRAGTLSGYSANLPTSAGQLQDLIWWLEGEITALPSGNPFLASIPAAWAVWNSPIDANGAFGVMALNVTYQDANHTISQDQLAIVPEPGTMIAGALLLLPFAASTIRRFRKS